MNTPESLKHTKWECKYHIVWIPKYRKKHAYPVATGLPFVAQSDACPTSPRHSWSSNIAVRVEASTYRDLYDGMRTYPKPENPDQPVITG